MKKDYLRNDNKQRNIVLLVVIAMTFMATLDSSIVNVALPVLSSKLNVPLASIEWIVTSYSIVICSTLLFFGRLGDIIGKTKVFQVGTIVFTIASMLCGFSSSFILLIVCRFIQGIGASAYMANNHGIITELFEKEKRGKALGILVTAVAIGNMLGPSVGGVILSLLNWNAIFFINVPIGIIVFILGIKFLPVSKRNPERMDKKGALLQFLGTTLLFGSLIASQQIGFFNPYMMVGILFAFIFIIWFLMLERKQKQPLLDLTIFKNMQFSLNLLCALTSFVCIAASSILIPFYLQNTLKLSPIQAGIFMMLSPFILAVFSPIFGSISDKVESEKIILIGLFVMSVGFFLMSRLSEHSLIVFCAIFISTMAVGQALFQPANNALIMSTCSKNKLGIVGSVNSLVRNLGQIVGITLSTTLLYSFMSYKIGYRVYDYIKGKDFVFVYGMRNVYLILVVLCLLGALLTALRIFKTAKSRNIKN
ncbi:EmrB/QacA subfamily drug resistance transporter [Clostridium acetobutylicum]|uniref:MDR-type permease n=1 Tax=Clostridium acetobutylicum (strain ATCC 824 / DSM 792 / JCM 1419 / IAM 19013 / LMG 5710 / NBRC 13948 / NRRL B-527 / VKM B-1787 / 2291 / W) TaxID=272562 RepID=Q97J34_CLOAB|nr:MULTISPECIES: MFS transporter [Clostridium]AAK79420.1 MDR-type permease [Clostridium acetobutylicum ATCC 824]ADZ20505.1 MDR-type permease [Clostridium acetobutylicum EA 2018]AEI34712.1 MDR-type permease [Clostridium acetobutylicum DSM 1731]AWV81332.1 MFS transporter [Clostridium acetobutylicum]MBC2392967.1 MFS transporter [Clostridium acetobutylicum]